MKLALAVGGPGLRRRGVCGAAGDLGNDCDGSRTNASLLSWAFTGSQVHTSVNTTLLSLVEMRESLSVTRAVQLVDHRIYQGADGTAAAWSGSPSVGPAVLHAPPASPQAQACPQPQAA